MTWRLQRGRRPARGVPARRVAVLAAMIAGAGTGLAGCADAAQAPMVQPPGRNQAIESAAEAARDPETVLKQLATRLHTHVQGLRTGLPLRSTTTFIDEKQACKVGVDADWPAQWIFDQRLYLTTTDARPFGHIITQRYADQGWTVRILPAVQGNDQYTLRRDGFEISLTAGDNDGAIDLHTNGPCVDVDGALVTPAPD